MVRGAPLLLLVLLLPASGLAKDWFSRQIDGLIVKHQLHREEKKRKKREEQKARIEAFRKAYPKIRKRLERAKFLGGRLPELPELEDIPIIGAPPARPQRPPSFGPYQQWAAGITAGRKQQEEERRRRARERHQKMLDDLGPEIVGRLEGDPRGDARMHRIHRAQQLMGTPALDFADLDEDQLQARLRARVWTEKGIDESSARSDQVRAESLVQTRLADVLDGIDALPR